MRRSYQLFLNLFILIGALLPFSVKAQPVSMINPDENNFLFCSIFIDKTELCEDLGTYVDDRGLFLPLGGVSSLLEFGLEVQPDSGKASGCLWDEAHPFSLDISSQSVIMNGKRLPYTATQVEAHSDDIYVESSLLAKWFGISVQADRYDAVVILHPSIKLPIQLRLERENRISRVYGVDKKFYFPRADNPYRFIDGFSLDFSIGSGLFYSNQTTSIVEPTYAALLTGDFLWMNGSIAVAGKLDGSDFTPNNIYGVLRRMDADGTLLGPLHATEVSFGRVSAVIPSLTGASASGYGAAIGNIPLTSPSYFDLQTLSGPLLPGWDVQLYQNDCYLDYRKADESGIYTFSEIPLVFGMNVLRLEFHGPLGQIKTEEHIYNVGSNMLKPGSFYYRASATAETMGGQYAFQTSYGLSKYVSLTASTLSGVSSDGRSLYLQAGMAGYFNQFQIDASVANDTRHSGFSADFGLRSQIFGLGLSWRGIYYSDEWENASSLTTRYKARSALRADNIHYTIGELFFSVAPSETSTFYRNGDRFDVFKVQVFQSYKSLQFRTTFTLNNYAFKAMDNELEALGYTTLNWRLGKTSFLASVDYGLYPGIYIDSFSMVLNRNLNKDIQLSANLIYYPLPELFSGSALMSWNLGVCKLGLSGSCSSLGILSLGATISTNITLDAPHGSLTSNASESASQGSMAARAYLDTNYNKIWDDGEKPVEGVGFIIGDSRNDTVTDAKGYALLRGLPSNVPVNISVAEESLGDFSLVSADKGVSCVLHPGTAARLDFPLWITGEITGTVWSVEGDLRRSLAGATLELLDASGAVVGSVRSAYDGYYSFSAVKVGEYTLRLIRKIADGTVKYMSRIVLIPAEGGYVDGVDLEYRPTNGTP